MSIFAFSRYFVVQILKLLVGLVIGGGRTERSGWVVIVFLFGGSNCWAEVFLDETISPWPPYYWSSIQDDFPSQDEAYNRCVSFAFSYVREEAERYCYLPKNPRVKEYYVGYFRDDEGYFHRGVFTFGKCTPPQFFNVSTAECGSDEQKGAPPVESCVGNPINIAIGNKFQQEADFQSQTAGAPSFSRSYNSLDGLWRHNYSTFIRFAIGKLSLIHADGRESFFSVSGDTATPYPNETGTLIKLESTWLYTADNNEQFIFDSSGQLIKWSSPTGAKHMLAYSGRQVTVTGSLGQALTFTQDAQHQPLSLSTEGLQITYVYDANKHLSSLMRTRDSGAEQRLFHYEDARNPALLTGITDERGVRFATWAYDDKGRAVSSQHSGGAGLTQVTYNADGSSTVVNELRKPTTYRYQQIGGVKRVTSIEGEPTASCPASNSIYTYNDWGQVLTKTDAEGRVTTFTYNDRSLETSRTEAGGTPLARTVTTEWDPVRFLPVRVIEPERTTVYSYDEQGRESSRQVMSR